MFTLIQEHFPEISWFCAVMATCAGFRIFAKRARDEEVELCQKVFGR